MKYQPPVTINAVTRIDVQPQWCVCPNCLHEGYHKVDQVINEQTATMRCSQNGSRWRLHTTRYRPDVRLRPYCADATCQAGTVPHWHSDPDVAEDVVTYHHGGEDTGQGLPISGSWSWSRPAPTVKMFVGQENFVARRLLQLSEQQLVVDSIMPKRPPLSRRQRFTLWRRAQRQRVALAIAPWLEDGQW